jgi:uncharacterized protein
MTPLFIDLGTAPLESRFALLHRPAGPARGLVVFAPAFGEEMNRSRPMAALQARALAAAGHWVLQPDLLGCGDSAGDLADASWARWVDDIVAAAAWLRAEANAPELALALWGQRAGALLAAQAAAGCGEVAQLLLWQPPGSGKPLLQQFLRLAMAADLLEGSDGANGGNPRARTGTETLRARLQAGETLEIAGYRLPPAVALGLEAARLAPVPGLRRLVWLETIPRAEPALAPAAAAVIAGWRETGTEVLAHAVSGPAFWQTTEIEEAPALLAATLQAMAAPFAAPAAAAAGAPAGV